MNRRNFVTSFASVPIIAATPAIAELLEPKRTIFLPPRWGWPAVDTPTDRLDILYGYSPFLQIADLVTFSGKRYRVTNSVNGTFTLTREV